MPSTPRDWLLLMLGLRVDGRSPALDPVRIQKSLFLLCQRGVVDADQRYPFDPYHYGPYSFALRDDLDELVTDGLVARKPVAGYSWSRYHLTDRGLDTLRARFSDADRRELEQATAIKQHVSELSFNDLLDEVYDEFPAYATRSVFVR